MSSEKKRKSLEAAVPAAKKAKTNTTLAKSADRPAPLKSALKKATKVETTVVEEPAKKEKKDKKDKKEKKSKAIVEVAEELEQKKTKVEKIVVEKPKEKKTKKITKTVVEEPVQEDDEEENKADNIDAGTDLTPDQTAALLAGFSSDEEEDEEQQQQESGIAISRLPSAPLPAPTKTKTQQTTTDEASETTPGVIYISRLPHGFFEPQMRAYFSQFGSITHLRLARNRKTGKSKHFAFVEFAAASVADIVAKTMDKYLLFGHILQVRRVPGEQVKEGIWKGPRGKVAPKNRLEGARLRKGAERAVWERRVTREEGRRLEKAERLRELGYEFDMPAIKGVQAVPVQKGAAAAVEEAEGVLLIEGKKTEVEPLVEEKIEAVIEDGKISVVQEKKIKRKSTDGVTTTKVKKAKTKA